MLMQKLDMSGAVRGKAYVRVALRSLRDGHLEDAAMLLKDADREYQRFAKALKDSAREVMMARKPHALRRGRKTAEALERRADRYDEKAWWVAKLSYGIEILDKGKEAVRELHDQEWVDSFLGDAERASRIIGRLKEAKKD